MQRKGRDLIIIGGQNAVGKSTAVKVVIQALQKQGIPCSEVPFASYRTLLQLTKEDDTQGGYHHYHLWCPETDLARIHGHTHSDAQHTPIEPFLVIGNTLPDELDRRKFHLLSALPVLENHIWIADMGGGVNTHPQGSLLSLVDYSFQRKCDQLRARLFPSIWLLRVRAALHIHMNAHTRSFLYDERTKQAYARAEIGKVSFLKSGEAKGFYGKDDFSAMERLLIETGLSPVYVRQIKNDGTLRYFERLHETITDLFPPPR